MDAFFFYLHPLGKCWLAPATNTLRPRHNSWEFSDVSYLQGNNSTWKNFPQITSSSSSSSLGMKESHPETSLCASRGEFWRHNIRSPPSALTVTSNWTSGRPPFSLHPRGLLMFIFPFFSPSRCVSKAPEDIRCSGKGNGRRRSGRISLTWYCVWKRER